MPNGLHPVTTRHDERLLLLDDARADRVALRKLSPVAKELAEALADAIVPDPEDDWGGTLQRAEDALASYRELVPPTALAEKEPD